MQKINILCLGQDYFIGGAEVMLFNLLSRVDKKHFNCIFCSYKKSGKVFGLMEKSNCKIEFLKEGISKKKQLKKIINKYNIRIAYLTTYKFLPEALLLRGLGCKILYHMQNHLGMSHGSLPQKNRKRLLKIIYCLSDRLIACSNIVKGQFSFIKNNMVQVVFNGVDTVKYSGRNIGRNKLKSNYRIPLSYKIVSLIGRVTPGKGQKIFIRACREIKDKYGKVKFFIIGECVNRVYSRELEEEARRLSLSKDIIFTGFKSNIHEFIRDMDIIVLPSKDEGMPVSLLEAMASGKAVIGIKKGGTSELVKDKKTGILIRSADKENISRAVLSLLSNDRKRIYIGSNARKDIARKYNINVFVKKLEAIFKEVAKPNSSHKILCQR